MLLYALQGCRKWVTKTNISTIAHAGIPAFYGFSELYTRKVGFCAPEPAVLPCLFNNTLYAIRFGALCVLRGGHRQWSVAYPPLAIACGEAGRGPGGGKGRCPIHPAHTPGSSPKIACLREPYFRGMATRTLKPRDGSAPASNAPPSVATRCRILRSPTPRRVEGTEPNKPSSCTIISSCRCCWFT